MHRSLITAASAVTVLLLAGAPDASAAPMGEVALRAPPLAAPAACRFVRERIERPNGAVVFKNRRECDTGFRPAGPDWAAPACRFVRERIVRPDGSVEHRSVRRCD